MAFGRSRGLPAVVEGIEECRDGPPGQGARLPRGPGMAFRPSGACHQGARAPRRGRLAPGLTGSRRNCLRSAPRCGAERWPWSGRVRGGALNRSVRMLFSPRLTEIRSGPSLPRPAADAHDEVKQRRSTPGGRRPRIVPERPEAVGRPGAAGSTTGTGAPPLLLRWSEPPAGISRRSP